MCFCGYSEKVRPLLLLFLLVLVSCKVRTSETASTQPTPQSPPKTDSTPPEEQNPSAPVALPPTMQKVMQVLHLPLSDCGFRTCQLESTTTPDDLGKQLGVSLLNAADHLWVYSNAEFTVEGQYQEELANWKYRIVKHKDDSTPADRQNTFSLLVRTFKSKLDKSPYVVQRGCTGDLEDASEKNALKEITRLKINVSYGCKTGPDVELTFLEGDTIAQLYTADTSEVDLNDQVLNEVCKSMFSTAFRTKFDCDTFKMEDGREVYSDQNFGTSGDGGMTVSTLDSPYSY